MREDDAPTWLEDELEPPPGRRRAARWLALAGLPWLALAAWVVLEPGVRDHQATGGDALLPTQVTAAAAGETTPEVGAATGEPPDEGPADPVTPDEELRAPPGTSSGTADGPLLSEMTAVAITTVRATFVEPGPRLPVAGLPTHRGAYLEHITPESVELVDPDTVVVVLSLVVLPVEDDAYGAAEQRRAAIPVTVADGVVRPAGAPWWLPTPTLELARPGLEPVDQPELRVDVADALAAAGFGAVRVRDLQRTASGIYVADVHASTPDGPAVDGPVWLHEHDGRLRVAGTGPAQAGADPSG